MRLIIAILILIFTGCAMTDENAVDKKEHELEEKADVIEHDADEKADAVEEKADEIEQDARNPDESTEETEGES